MTTPREDPDAALAAGKPLGLHASAASPPPRSRDPPGPSTPATAQAAPAAPAAAARPPAPLAPARRPRAAWFASRPLARVALAVLVVASVLWVLDDAGLFEPGKTARGLRNIGIFVGDMLPPDTDGALFSTLADALLETVQMAWAGTLLGAAFALPFSILAASSLFSPLVAYPTRAFLAAVRTIPAILWAIFFVVTVGLGALAGILAIAAYTMGYLGKLFYEAFEAVDPEILEAARATGASRLQIARHAVIPEAGNALVSQSLFAFEYNVRASSILGLVGAGGIGFYLLRYVELFEYQKLTTALVLLFALVIAVDAASRVIRKRYLAPRAA